MVNHGPLVPLPPKSGRLPELGNISRNTVYRLLDEKELIAVHIGRRIFITQASIDAYVNRLVEKAVSA